MPVMKYIKNFQIFENNRSNNLCDTVSEAIGYEEEDDNNYEYKVGDFITVVRVPRGKHWLHKTDRRTFKLTAEPTAFYGGLMWSTDGGKENIGQGCGIQEEFFRPATIEEIEKWNKNPIDNKEKIDIDYEQLEKDLEDDEDFNQFLDNL